MHAWTAEPQPLFFLPVGRWHGLYSWVVIRLVGLAKWVLRCYYSTELVIVVGAEQKFFTRNITFHLGDPENTVGTECICRPDVPLFFRFHFQLLVGTMQGGGGLHLVHPKQCRAYKLASCIIILGPFLRYTVYMTQLLCMFCWFWSKKEYEPIVACPGKYNVPSWWLLGRSNRILWYVALVRIVKRKCRKNWSIGNLNVHF